MHQTTPPPPANHRIPSLDGLRALSIFLVIALHIIQRMSLSRHIGLFWFGLFNGETGVSIFFEISGFLITTLLISEHRKTGAISLSGFYLRRAFRILPPLYLYIAVACVLGGSGALPLSWPSAASAAFFFHNLFAPGGMWQLEHLWSISVEEQFYLVWPFVLYWAAQRNQDNALRRAAIFPAAVILLSPVFRVALGISHSEPGHTLALHLFKFDFIMFGCLVALLQGTERFETIYRAATKVWWLPPAVILFCDFISARFQNYFELTIGATIQGTAIAAFLLWSTRNPHSAVGRVLNLRLVAWVGVLSYSVYLWQTLWLHSGNEKIFGPYPWVGTPPFNCLGIALCAVASYYLVEQPSLRLRAMLTRRKPALPEPPSNIEKQMAGG